MIALRTAALLGVLVGVFVLYLLIVALIPGFRVARRPLKRDGGPRRGEPPASRREVSFTVGTARLGAWLYLPDAPAAPVPCVVMAHGLGATRDAGLEAYALRFNAAGFAVLAFDYRCLGTSEGEPRQLVWIPHQIEDTLAAVEFARGLEQVDPARIALWGTSLSAGHAIVVAAKDGNIACITAQCPFLHGTEAGMGLLKRTGLRPVFRIVPHGQRDLVRSFLRLSPHRIPLAGPSGSIAVMADDAAWRVLGQLAPDDFVNEVCARIVIRMDKYGPVHQARRLCCPVLLQLTDDEARFQHKAVAKIRRHLGDAAEVIHYPIGHFDIHLGENFERAVNHQIEFLGKHLAGA